jgi:hypothetical protein
MKRLTPILFLLLAGVSHASTIYEVPDDFLIQKESVFSMVKRCTWHFSCYRDGRLGSTITTINASDLIKDSRSTINTNFSNLNTDKLETTSIDTCSEIATIVSGETGTCGSLVLSVSPAFTGTPTFTGLISSASSSFAALLSSYSTSTQATSTYLAVSTLASTSQLTVSLTSSHGGLATFLGGLTSTAGNTTVGVLLGSIDSGGATSFEIPNGASPTVSVTGQVALDTTSDQFIGFGASAKKVYGNGSFYRTITFPGVATTTSWTGTTSIPLGPSGIAETWNSVQCFTDAGTLGVSFNDGTNRFDYIPTASTTVSVFTFTTNNTFTKGEKRYIDIGNPASSPRQISCTVDISYTAD